jgi:hypothetical protein
MKNLLEAFEGKSKPNYDNIRLVTVEEPRQKALENRMNPDDYQAFTDIKREMLNAVQASTAYVAAHGFADERLQIEAGVAHKKYQELRTKHLKFPENKDLTERIERGKIDVSPIGPRKGVADPIGSPLPIVTAHNVLGTSPRSGEFAAAFGMVPMYCYDMTDDQLDRIIDHMDAAPHYYRTALTATRTDTVKKVRNLLRYADADSAVFFLDKGGKFEGAISNQEVSHLGKDKDEMHAFGFAKRNISPVQDGITPAQAYTDMQQKETTYLPVDCEDNTVRIITETQAILYKYLKPFTGKKEKGLDFMMSLGMNKRWDPVSRLNKYKDRINNWIFDTAHMNREDCFTLAQQLRDISPDAIMAAGTVIGEEPVRRLLEMGYQYVKSGIGGGKQCTTTSVTGVGLPAAWAHYLGGLAAASTGKGTVWADGGFGNDAAPNKALTFPGVSHILAGSRFAPLAESAAEFSFDDAGRPFKIVQGEASSPRALARMMTAIEARGGEMTDDERQIQKIGLHSEGSSGTRMYPESGADNFGLMALHLQSSFQSKSSYLDANNAEQAVEFAQYEIAD